VTQVACGSSNRWDPADTTSTLAAVYGLFSTAGADRTLHSVLSAKKATLEIAVSNRFGGEFTAPCDELAVGTRVFHKGRGRGRVLDVRSDHVGSMVYRVQFDDGAVHMYSARAARKLKVVASAAEHDIEASVLSAFEAAGRAARAVNDEAREIAASIAAHTVHVISAAGDVVSPKPLSSCPQLA
jgi:hypothetical protein